MIAKNEPSVNVAIIKWMCPGIHIVLCIVKSTAGTGWLGSEVAPPTILPAIAAIVNRSAASHLGLENFNVIRQRVHMVTNGTAISSVATWAKMSLIHIGIGSIAMW